ncbi:hypothetical protein ACSJ9E_001344 [Campylobacter jejuni]
MKRNVCYLNYKGALDHWFIPKLLNILWEKSNKNIDLFYQNKSIFLNQEQEIQTIKEEIKKLNSNQIILLSCKGIYQLCSSFEFLSIFKEILYFIGISDIKIIVYFRRPADYFISYYTQAIKSGASSYANIFQKNPNEDIHFMIAHQLQYSKVIKIYENVFKHKNIIIKSFNKDKFLNNNLIDDFLSIFKINRDSSFKTMETMNESLDILGINICNILYEDKNFSDLIIEKNLIPSFVKIMEKFFSTRDKFLPKKTIYNNYNLFYNKEIITLILTFQNQQIQKNKEFQNIANSFPLKKQILELANLEQDLIIKKLESKKLAKSLGLKMSIINPKITFIQANSKSILGYIRIPYVLSYIKDKHKFEQKAYEEKIKENPNLALPPLETYPDYNEALKEKECFTYKLGKALMQANKNWYGGGVYQIYIQRCA